MLPTWLDIGLTRPLQIREERLNGRPDACRVAYMSDIHLRPGRSAHLTNRVLEVVAQCVPHLILLGGDLVDRVSELDALSELVRSLLLQAPVMAIGGNHDASVGIGRVRDAVMHAGADWIHDREVHRQHGDRVVSISGPDMTGTPSGDVRIQCAHNPRIWKTARHRGFDLVLSGHLHGCQFVAFEYHDRLFPGAWFYPYCYLSHQAGPTKLVVSRGVSDLIPIRWRCPREIVLCHV